MIAINYLFTNVIAVAVWLCRNITFRRHGWASGSEERREREGGRWHNLKGQPWTHTHRLVQWKNHSLKNVFWKSHTECYHKRMMTISYGEWKLIRVCSVWWSFPQQQQPSSSVVTRDNASHAWLRLSLSVFVSPYLAPSVYPLPQFLVQKHFNLITSAFCCCCFCFLSAFTCFLTSYSNHTPFPTLLSCLLTSMLRPVWWSWHEPPELSCTDVFDSSPEVSWVSYMCGVDRLLPQSVYWTVKPGGHRPSWAHSEAPHSHQKGTHFIKNHTNNHSSKHFLSHSTADQVCVILFFIFQYCS